MNNGHNIGVFLCRCGKKIAPHLDLESLKGLLTETGQASHVGIESFSCLAPGLKSIREAVEQKGLDRVVIAGCESRLMMKKFERELQSVGLEQGQIDVVNLRGHVAAVHDLEPEAMVKKGAKLIRASMSGLAALNASPKEKVEMNGPVMILGGGIATYSAAQELIDRGIDCILALWTNDYEDELRILHEHYPGERHYYDRLEKIMKDVDESPLVRRVTVGEPIAVTGRTGSYQITFSSDGNGTPPRVYQASAIIACLDGQMLNQGTDFGHDGRTVICHTEAEEEIWTHGVPEGRVVFWINDYEVGTPQYAHLSARTAWSMARYMRENSAETKITMLYNRNMALPLSAGERKKSRELGVDWIPYDPGLRPTVQFGFVTYCDDKDRIEYEIPYDRLILSPRRSVGVETTQVARILGLDPRDGQFLQHHHQRVRPEMHGSEDTFMAGSALYPCDLHEALRQGT